MATMVRNYYKQGLEIGWELARTKKQYTPCLICNKPVRTNESRKKMVEESSVA